MGIPFVKGLRCPVSDPANPHTLPRSDGEHLLSGCFKCGKQHVYQDDLGLIQDHYRCTTCDVWFHTFCQDRPRKIRHPYHLQHPLTLTLIDGDDETVIAISEQENKSESVFNKGCNWCGGELGNLDKKYYRCSICGFCLDHSCVKKSPPPTITNPKSHHHPLVLFPRPFSLPCDACGLVDVSDPVYACYQCNYMVHQSCISLPRVIKITRHPHRLSHTPFFQPQVSTSCQICYKAVDIKYGQYACHLEGCSYVAHSTCATHENVWDGNELEWEPEEETCETEEDIEPFEKVGVGLIRYFLHQEHHLRLLKYDRVRDADDKQCEACILPMDARDFYSCMQCDFFLHEMCYHSK
ncbi:unnamed protein product [Microthlaspi erraticum]|uniref:DC1 domain-containing protein n=1 Tax=Microthlaspi erraticum TaxID=1685480 RepID=A0A6D2L7C9_9BRAS|nr:unnamed protein product [Microthlaspi erraticum]